MNVHHSNLGEVVICDSCGKDYTILEDKGGIIFGSYAYCPACSPQMISNAKKYKEENYLTIMDKEKSFKQNVLDYRVKMSGSADATRTIISF